MFSCFCILGDYFLKQIEKRIDALMKAKKRNAYKNINPVIICNSETDPDGKKAAEEFYKKYPDYDGALIFLPEKERLDED
jgi:penicillin-binding protein-related factor A (putative recombinase)